MKPCDSPASAMTGGNRAAWPSGPLRRQKSCMEGLLTANVRSRSERYASHALQRQFSVDQDVRPVTKDDSRTADSILRAAAATSNAPKKRLQPADSVPRPEPHQGNGSDGRDRELSERLKKALNRRDNRINLNIVLTQMPNIPEPEANHASDSESQSNDLVQAPIDSTTLKEGADSTLGTGETKSVLKTTSGRSSARRPPLVRAMSAPIRPSVEPPQNRRKNTRRRKYGRDREENLLITSRKSLERQDAITSDTSPVCHTKSCERKSVVSQRSTIGGCDIVTLVSLLSSGGSDSEREDNGHANTQRAEKRSTRPPSLKKTGKSVSFQDNDITSFPSPSKEFPTMFRRGSVAPLAARIRSNRPPTAPPGSVFITDYDRGCTDDTMAAKKAPMRKAVTNKTLHEPPTTALTEDDHSPDNLKTAKERECWKLFQKMTNRGISVSYDTILRGMLTPTELRMIQKKQEQLENAKRSSLEEQNSSKNASTVAGSISTQNRDKVKNTVK
ncbi:hypothetical protein DMENIID0001_155960 [Sergentomyia squamirostris]